MEDFVHTQLAAALVSAVSFASPHEAGVAVARRVGGSLTPDETKALAGMISDVLAMVRKARA